MCNYPEQLDCVWLATDEKGHVGAFVTGGLGPIPKSVLSDLSIPIDDIETMIYRLPKVSEANLLVKMTRPDDFIDMAQRGLFVFDWRDVHRTIKNYRHAYELVAMPLNPIKIDMLSESIRRFGIATTFSDFLFIEGQDLDVRNFALNDFVISQLSN